VAGWSRQISMVAHRYCSTTLAIHQIKTKEVKPESQIGGNYFPTEINLTVISVQPNFVHAFDLDPLFLSYVHPPLASLYNMHYLEYVKIIRKKK